MVSIVKTTAFIACAWIGWALPSVGEHIPETMARKIAAQHYATTRTRNAQPAPLHLVHEQKTFAALSDLYVYAPANGKGFVVVAGDDCLPEIIGYSLKNSFHADSIPPSLQNLFARYGAFIAANAGKTKAKNMVKTRAWGAVAPLLGDVEWGQSTPYSNLTPLVGNSNAPTGCVATAMAQVMRFHSWPASAKGNGEYTINGKGKNSVTLDGHTYNWASMLNRYTSTSSADAQNAVARLMRDVGGAVKMDYSAIESSAYSIHAATALLENFQYSHTLQLMYNQYHTIEEWEQTIQTELQNNRPILYGGGSPEGGHAFVCDGYDGHALYHINWGWNGLANGFYSLLELLPTSQGTGAGGGGGYISGQDIIVGIQPNYTDRQATPLIYCEEFKIEADGETAIHSVKNAVVKAYNYSGIALNGSLGIEIKNSNNQIVKQSKTSTLSKGIKLGWGPNDTSIPLALDDLTPGTYYAYPVFYMSDKNQWIKVRLPFYDPQFKTLSISSNGEVVINDDPSYKVNLSATIETPQLHAGQNTISITFTNNGSTPYNGLIGFRLVSNDKYSTFTPDANGVHYTNALIEPTKSVTYRSIIPTTSGTENGEEAKFIQILYDSTNNNPYPTDQLSHIPHHILATHSVSVDNSKMLSLPHCKIVSNLPTECRQNDFLSVNVSLKLNNSAHYYSGTAALQFIEYSPDRETARIRGTLKTANVTLSGASEIIVTFEDSVRIANGVYYLSVGLLKADPDSGKLGWYAAPPQTAKALEEVERQITVRGNAKEKSMLPVVIHLNTMGVANKENDNSLPLRAFPNPANSVLHVETTNGQPLTNVELYSPCGTRIRSISAPSGALRLSIDTALLPKGLYILRATNRASHSIGATTIVIE